MKHITYGETEFATDGRLADLVLEYATMLARSSSADTVSIPGRFPSGEMGTISMLVGPASQITAWEDEEPFNLDVASVTADVRHRIHLLSANIAPSVGEDGPPGIDAFDDLA